jgi:class 3 adenylate cyclase/tetratricopeptide (TPR) repeat protein
MNQHPDEISPSGDSHRLAAIVFADIVGSTATMERDEKLALKNLARMREVTYPQVEAHAGKVIKELGDGFLAVFNSAIKATTCSLAIQKELQGEEDPKLRISIHIGDVVVDQGDVFGSGVNIASRLNSHAPPGGIAVSGDVWRQLQNKADYSVRSLGFKELKGVGEPFEVFELLESAQAPGKRTPLLQGLKLGHIPHYLGPYLVGGWTFMHFTNWFAGQYLLSPYLPKFIFTLLVSLIPTAILLGYLQKQRGPKAKRYRMIAIPANLVLAGFLLFGLYRGKDLGSMMINVSAMSEEGQSVQRVVPKGEFRKNLFLFYFDNVSGDTTLNWAQYGMAYLLEAKLMQDPFINPWLLQGGQFGTDRTLLVGYPEGTDLPVSAKQKVAKDSHVEFFFSGQIGKANGQYTFQGWLYETPTCKAVAETRLSGPDFFVLGDELAGKLRHDLKIPARHISETKDLPASEILTASLPAFAAFSRGRYFGEQKGDFAGTTPFLEKAVEIDSTFVFAQYLLGLSYMASNRLENGMLFFPKIFRNLYRLPEKLQFQIKTVYYGINREGDKVLKLQKMWIELYPDDPEPHRNLATLYRDLKQFKESLAEFKRLYEIDPGQNDILLEIARTHKEMGEFEPALKHYQQFSALHPDDPEIYLAIGDLCKAFGHYDQAKTQYEKGLLLNPSDLRMAKGVADVEQLSGNYDAALSRYESLLQQAETPKDRSTIHEALGKYYEARGQLGKWHEHWNLALSEMEKFYPPIFFNYTKLRYLDKYVRAGKKEEAFKIIQKLQDKVYTNDRIVVALAYAEMYLGMKDWVQAEKAIKGFDAPDPSQPAEQLTLAWSRRTLLNLRGKIAMLKGSYPEAIDLIQQELQLAPTAFEAHVSLGCCYRNLKDYKKAEEHLNQALKIYPYFPEAHYELALVYAETGKTDRAVEHLKGALHTWAPADPDFEPAQKAREKLAGLQGGNR